LVKEPRFNRLVVVTQPFVELFRMYLDMESAPSVPAGGLEDSFPQLSVIVPARNEAAIIGRTLTRLSDYLDRLPMSYELIVGDSGSTDDTFRAALGLGLPNLRAVREEQGGKGRILTASLREARGRIIGFIDADLEIPESTLGRLLEAIHAGADVAIASKANAGDRRPLRRRVVTWTLNVLVRILFGTPFSDHQAGCKLFRASVLRPILGRVTSLGWLWDTEVLVNVVRARGSVVEVPTSLSAGLRPDRVGWRAKARGLYELIQLRMLLVPRLSVTPAERMPLPESRQPGI
jgi:glycosyltransferase involved in cell wall biosynthesis